MKCRATKSQFSAYIESELSESNRKRVADHLDQCPKCAHELEALRKTVTLLRWIPPIEAEPDFTAQVMARVRTEENRLSPAARLRAWWEGLTFDAPWRGLELPVPALASAGGVGLVAGVLMTLRLAGMPAPVVEDAPMPTGLAGGTVANPSMVSHPGHVTAPAQSGGGVAFGQYQQQAGQGRRPVSGSFDWQRNVASPSPPITSGGVGFTPTGQIEIPWSESMQEGPPSVIAVEYVIKRVRIESQQGEPARQLPAGVHIENGIVTF